MTIESSPPPTPDAAPPRLTMAAFWRDFGDEVLSLDRGLPWTFAQMMLRPGFLVRRYVLVRDPRVVRPLRYFLIGFALLAVSAQISGAAAAALGGFERGFTAEAGPGTVGAAIIAVLGQVQWLLLGIGMPAMAAALLRVHRAQQPNFAEMWVLSMFVAGHCLLLAALPMQFGPHLPAFILPLMLLLPALWFVWTTIGYFTGPMAPRLFRAVLAMILAGVLMILFLLGCVAITSVVLRLWPT